MLEYLLILLSYLLGSISPTYIIAKIKGINLKKGTGNLGASNAFLTIGPFSGLLVAIFDIFKGFLPVYIAFFLNLQEIYYYLFGLSSILGHIFPFYLKFKGGKGVSTSIGVVLALFFFGNNLDYQVQISILILLYSLIIFLIRIFKHRTKDINVKRKILRLSALLIPVIYYLTDRDVIILLLSSLFVVSLIVDILRIKGLPLFKKILKEKEKSSISAISMFLLSCLLTVIFFKESISVLVITISIVGDLAAEITGKAYGKTKIIGNKSLQGTASFFTLSIVSALIVMQFYEIKLYIILLASLVASLIELFSYKIDDNLTVPFLTALILSLF